MLCVYVLFPYHVDTWDRASFGSCTVLFNYQEQLLLKITIARITHWCSECGRIIKKSEFYYSASYYDYCLPCGKVKFKTTKKRGLSKSTKCFKCDKIANNLIENNIPTCTDHIGEAITKI